MTIINIINNYKYIILSLIVIILFFALVTQLFNTDFFRIKEGFTSNPTTTVDNILYGNITYDPNTFNKSNSNINTQLNDDNNNDNNTNNYSHNVNIPLNDNQGCQNACYNSKCSKTGKQCSTDVDCYQDGCHSLLKQVHDTFVAEQSKPLTPQSYVPADSLETGRLIYNQNPQHSSLTYDISTSATIINKNAKVPRPYDGYKVWEPTFNLQTKLYEDKLAYNYFADPEQYITMPEYKKTLTTTGLFYDIGPTPANAYLS
jgi:hypothetical protein